MRLFLDTNIFPEFIDRRAQYNEVCLLIDAIHDGHFDACISTGVVAGRVVAGTDLGIPKHLSP